MENKHTPGPWRVKDVQPDAWTRQVWTDESHGSVMIATTGGIDKEANAALIAAAPDMYEALEAVRAIIPQHNAGTPWARAADKIHAALAKAEGR